MSDVPQPRCNRVTTLLMLRSVGALSALTFCPLSIAADPPKETRSLSGTWIVQPLSLPGLVARDFVKFAQGAKSTKGVWLSEPLNTEYPIDDVKRNGDSVAFRVDYGVFGKGRWTGHFTGINELQMRSTSGDSPSEAPSGTEPPTILRRVSAGEISKVRARGRDLITRKLALPALRELAANGLALTPPMGWNSWNHFWSAIDDSAVRTTADALAASGLRDAGYVYVVIDDGWQGSRDAHGVLRSNSKFPDMQALADYVHSKGLKLGIYTSPGPLSCGGYVGSHGHEAQDAETFARWGVDFLKYDWCSAGSIYRTQQEMHAVYQKMGEALQHTNRPIVYSLCQYGLFDVGTWGRKVGGNLWRTSDDISDSWPSMSANGFEKHGDPAYAGPGSWNDPDMLEIGNGGMTAEEYRTHMTLWAVLAAPLILGNDLKMMTDDVKGILTNKEVIAVDQDALGRQGRRVLKEASAEVWTKPLSDGSTAVAIFNRGADVAQVEVKWSDLALPATELVRDLWRHSDVGSVVTSYKITVAPHASVLLRAAAVN